MYTFVQNSVSQRKVGCLIKVPIYAALTEITFEKLVYFQYNKRDSFNLCGCSYK